MLIVLVILYLFGLPLAIMIMSQRWPVIQKISPMVILYVIGIVAGNTFFSNAVVGKICTSISNVVVLMAIPLMLMGCDFRSWSTKSVVKTFLVGLVSVLLVTITGYFIFHSSAHMAQISDRDYAKISAVMTGIYIGGIPNLAPVSKAVDMPHHLFLIVSGYDLIVTGLYLLLIVFFGEKIIRKVFKINHLPANEQSDVLSDEYDSIQKKDYKYLIINRGAGILTAFMVVVLSYGLSLLIPVENTVAIIIIILTTLSILLSFAKPIRRLEGTFDVGLYFVYVFCLAVATMVNIHEMEFSKYLFILYYIAFAVFGSLVLQIILAKIFKIDGDLVLVSSIALINSPPFVPMVAAVLNNKNVILPGIAIGLLGYAVGNYLGIGIFMLLS